MAQEPQSPWSRWDPAGYQFIPSITTTTVQSVLNRQYDAPSSGGIAGSTYTTVVEPMQGTLQSQRLNPNNTNLVNCYYGFENTLERTVISCYNDLGCCKRGCCEDASWDVKYGFSVALIVIFSVIVIAAVVFWFVIWLINRSKDKKMREEIEYHSDQVNNGQGGNPINMSSPYNSQNFVSPVLNQPYYDQNYDMSNGQHHQQQHYRHDGMGDAKYYEY
uniref:CX domain-containing protein n=1 Tax=Parastrongyloides trichosuri TaxID=131310 RepID=A0A0N5A0H2_PARTI